MQMIRTQQRRGRRVGGGVPVRKVVRVQEL